MLEQGFAENYVRANPVFNENSITQAIQDISPNSAPEDAGAIYNWYIDLVE